MSAKGLGLYQGSSSGGWKSPQSVGRYQQEGLIEKQLAKLPEAAVAACVTATTQLPVVFEKFCRRLL